MHSTAPILGNEPLSLIHFDDVVLKSLRETRTTIESDGEPAIVISARCDLLKDELRDLYARLLATN
ncbi:hypothetical protein DTL42_21925 [Bremerella cremea]|uniref:Uncharacterized protein n=1 Tax=Bremerella cremea TaxID=1031537 RepID=A0A368KN25_9BACT|nr:hypothetical protein [Bremerella cremea]RCS41232.1 hypothetical protein DTL42_21925 [Bremerella cremea]